MCVCIHGQYPYRPPQRWIPHPACPPSPWGPAQKPTQHKKLRGPISTNFSCVQFLEHVYTVLSEDTVCIGPARLKVTDWPTPLSHKNVQHFLGFVNFNWWFIRGFSTITMTLFSDSRHFLVWTAHKNLESLQTAKNLNYCHGSWALSISRFNFLPLGKYLTLIQALSECIPERFAVTGDRIISTNDVCIE